MMMMMMMMMMMIIIIIIIKKDENKLTAGFISSKFRYLKPESLFLFFKCWKIFSNLVRSIMSLFFPYFFSVFKVIYKFMLWNAKNAYVKDIRVTGGTSLHHNITHRSCSGWKSSV